MPSNVISINRSDDLSWILGDSKMDGLIEYLNKYGCKYNEDDIISDVSPSSYSQIEHQP